MRMSPTRRGSCDDAEPELNAFVIFVFFEVKHCLALAQMHIDNVVHALRHRGRAQF